MLLGFLKDPAPNPTKMLSLRSLCNLFQSYTSLVLKKQPQILPVVMTFLQNSDRNIRMAAITNILNFSIELLAINDDTTRFQLLEAIGAVFTIESDIQIALRMAYAIANLTY